MEIERITGSPTVRRYLPRCLPNGVPKDQQTIAEQHTELNTKWPYPRPTTWLQRSQPIFYQSCLPRWPQRSRLRTHQSYHPNNFHRETVHRDPAECRITRCRAMQMQCTKRLSESKARSYHGEYDHLLWSSRVRYGSMIYRPRPMQLASNLPLSNGHQQVTYENQRIWRCPERKLTSMSQGKTRSKW